LTLFRKPKKAGTVTPRLCGRCRERPGVVSFYPLDAARSPAAEAPESRDWWLCAECARLVGRDEPEGG
jgi:hypothetical protein